MQHRLEHGDIGIRFELQHMARMASQVGATRVGHNQRGAALNRVLDPGRCHWMVGGRVGADHEDQI